MTPRHREVYDYVSGYLQEKGYAPTLQEVSEAVGYTARSAAHTAVWALITEGYLAGAPGRTLRLGTRKPE